MIVYCDLSTIKETERRQVIFIEKGNIMTQKFEKVFKINAVQLYLTHNQRENAS